MKTEISEILGIPIEDYDTAFQQLDSKGAFDTIKVHKLLVLLIKKIEKLENASPGPVDAPKTPLKLDKIPVYNPDSEDCIVKVRDNKNKQIEYISHSKELEYFEPFIAKQIKTALANQLLNKRGIKTNSEDDLKEILKELEVVI